MEVDYVIGSFVLKDVAADFFKCTFFKAVCTTN